MSAHEHELDESEPRPPPRLSHLIAVLLELSMVTVFGVHHSWVGLLLALAYLWFSATLALFARYFFD